MMKLLAVIVLLLAGCTSVNAEQVPAETLEYALDAQEKWLRGLERGQPIQGITVAIVPNTQYLLEIFQHGTLYQYISGMYPITGTLYGLYFEAGRLKALLLEQDVKDFFQFERSYRHNNDQWLRSGMARTADWVETRDVLGHDFDARVKHRRGKTVAEEKTDAGEETDAREKTDSGNRTGASGAETLEVMINGFFFAPLIPGVGVVYLLSGGATTWDDKRASEDPAARQRAEALVGRLHPGTTSLGDMLRLMGSPDFMLSWVGGKVWGYDFPKIHIGTADGIVMWKEIGRVETPHDYMK